MLCGLRTTGMPPTCHQKIQMSEHCRLGSKAYLTKAACILALRQACVSRHCRLVLFDDPLVRPPFFPQVSQVSDRRLSQREDEVGVEGVDKRLGDGAGGLEGFSDCCQGVRRVTSFTQHGQARIESQVGNQLWHIFVQPYTAEAISSLFVRAVSSRCRRRVRMRESSHRASESSSSSLRWRAARN